MKVVSNFDPEAPKFFAFKEIGRKIINFRARHYRPD